MAQKAGFLQRSGHSRGASSGVVMLCAAVLLLSLLLVSATGSAARTALAGWNGGAAVSGGMETGALQVAGAHNGAPTAEPDSYDPAPIELTRFSFDRTWQAGEVRGVSIYSYPTYASTVDAELYPQDVSIDYSGDPNDFSWSLHQWHRECIEDPGNHTGSVIAEGSTLADQQNETSFEMPISRRDGGAIRDYGVNVCLVLTANEDLGHNVNERLEMDMTWRSAGAPQSSWSSPVEVYSDISTQEHSQYTFDFACEDESTFSGFCGWDHSSTETHGSGERGVTFDAADVDTASGKALHITGETRLARNLLPDELDELQVGDEITVTMRFRGEAYGSVWNRSLNMSLNSQRSHKGALETVDVARQDPYQDWTEVSISTVMEDVSDESLWVRIAAHKELDPVDFYIDEITVEVVR